MIQKHKNRPEGGLNGCPASQSRRKSIIHDIIEFFEISQGYIYDVSAPLYRDGLSITEIAEQTGLKRTAIWKALKAHQEDLHPKKAVPYERWRKGHKRTGARPPYGFCFLQGEVVREPKEYPTLLVIYKLWTQGGSIMSILGALTSKGMKSRTGKDWSYGVIKSIVRRIDSGAIIYQFGKLALSESFLSGMCLQPKNKSNQKKE